MAIDWNQPDFAFLRDRMREGTVTLFVGAGFSLESKATSGEPPPLGRHLARILGEYCGYGTECEEPLPVLFPVAIKRLGSRPLQDRLSLLFTIETASPRYQVLKSFTWRRIYSTNVDTLLEFIYRLPTQQRLDTIVCPAAVSDRDVMFGKLQSIHLHGHISTSCATWVFSIEDFARQTAQVNPWYQELVNDLQVSPTVFIGTFADDSPLYHYLAVRDARDSSHREYRPKSYLVAPNISPARESYLADRNIVPIRMTIHDFLEALSSLADNDDFSLESTRAKAFPHYTFTGPAAKERIAIVAQFDQIRHDNLPVEKTSRQNPQQFFFGGEPTWRDIAEHHDAFRDIVNEVTKAILPDSTEPKLVLLHGPAGSGKTTTAMRSATRAAQGGAAVYFSRNLERLDLEVLAEFAAEMKNSGQRLVFIIDSFFRHGDLYSAVLSELHRTPNISVLLVDRSNTYRRKGRAIMDLAPHEIQMPDLSEVDVERVLTTLRTNGALGVLRNQPPEDQKRAFMQRANRQMLVALREATSGKGFDLILEDEYQELPGEARVAYAIACIAVSVGAPGVYRKHLLPCLDGTNFHKGAIIDTLLSGVLVPANASGSMIKPRHRLIAQMIAEEVLPRPIVRDAIVRFLTQIAPQIIPSEITRRSPAYVAYRGMINCDGLCRLFADDYSTVIELFQDLRIHYDGDFLFWTQWAMVLMRDGQLDVAENYLNQSLAINSRNLHASHQMGILQLRRAIDAARPEFGLDRANQGIALLAAQIQARGDEDPYAYGAYLDYVRRWYASAGALVSSREWDSLRRIRDDAMARFGFDEFIQYASKEIDTAYMMRAVKASKQS